MPQRVRNVMTTDPVILESTTSLREAAQRMRDEDIGDVLVKQGGRLRGILTDRDIVVRAVAEGKDAESTTIDDVCSRELETVGPDDDLDEVVARMRGRAVRRIPVVENDVAVGVLSLGDVKVIRDQESALADISAKPGNV